MTNAVPYIIQGTNIILVIDGKSHTISKDTHISYTKIVEALKVKDWDALRDLVEPKKAIIAFGKGNMSIEGDVVYWKGQPFHNSLSTRMIDMYQDGFPIEPMVAFMENLMSNPSKRSVDQLYGFLEKNKLPITEDGHFLAYKKVRTDYLDIYSGTISNHVGAVVVMQRNLVDDNPDSHCSTGLHFCSESYLEHFGGRNDPVMILKINPADVVSVPTDYNGAKGRCMRYEVVGQVNGDPTATFSAPVNTEFSSKSARPFADTAGAIHEDKDEPGLDLDLDILNDENLGDDGLDGEQFYDLVRVHGNGDIVKFDLTIDEAREQVAKNVRQKKAQLKIVKAGTDEEVE